MGRESGGLSPVEVPKSWEVAGAGLGFLGAGRIHCGNRESVVFSFRVHPRFLRNLQPGDLGCGGWETRLPRHQGELLFPAGQAGTCQRGRDGEDEEGNPPKSSSVRIFILVSLPPPPRVRLEAQVPSQYFNYNSGVVGENAPKQRAVT